MRAGVNVKEKSSRNKPEFVISPARLTLVFVGTVLITARSAVADEHYDVMGQDVYRIGQAGTVSRVVYDGTQTLSVQREGKAIRYDAQARYRRVDATGKSDEVARFVQELSANGAFRDRLDDDPDFLTVLNQPFAVQLDAVTMHDLRHLHVPVPFDATSPLGGDAVLRGFLRPGTAGEISGHAAIAVHFRAEGPMSGPLPGATRATMSGRMRMDGTAYYAADSAMLLALDATLTIAAKLQQSGQTIPVQITYRRYIRAEPAAAKMPLPTPLASGAGTASPPFP
ncbi:MAG: hypothetical protein JO302_03490 [Candidatus Eremiobacteraeota bacterium]|nr:hypothetical protein [Candidatus Eremiobacteraeota bacterium]